MKVSDMDAASSSVPGDAVPKHNYDALLQENHQFRQKLRDHENWEQRCKTQLDQLNVCKARLEHLESENERLLSNRMGSAEKMINEMGSQPTESNRGIFGGVLSGMFGTGKSADPSELNDLLQEKDQKIKRLEADLHMSQSELSVAELKVINRHDFTGIYTGLSYCRTAEIDTYLNSCRPVYSTSFLSSLNTAEVA